MDPRLFKRLLWQAIPAALVISGVYFAVGSEGGLIQRYEQSQRLRTYEDRLTAVESHNAELRREIQRLRVDPTLIERAAAETLLVGRPGTVVYRFTEEKSP